MFRNYKRALTLICSGILTAYCGATSAAPTYYVDNINGNDSASGAIETPWKTLFPVNRTALMPGSSVLFKRGGTWHGSLSPRSGDEIDGHITYGAYGSGDKPRLLGSARLNDEADWIESPPRSNIWVSQVVAKEGSKERILNSDFSSADMGSWLKLTHTPTSAATFSRDTSDFFPPTLPAANQASIKVTVIAGTSSVNDIQLYAMVGQIDGGQCYKFSFNAKASTAMKLAEPFKLIKNSGNYDTYATAASPAPTIGTEWQYFETYFIADSSFANPRVSFMLGTAAPKNSTLNIDNVSFRECDVDKIVSTDVGSVIFDSERALVGSKVFAEAELKQDGQFFYDAGRKQLKLYSQRNPASAYPQLEAAMRRSVVFIGNKSYVTVRDLDLRYSGAHGVQTDHVKHIVLDSLDISYVGGSVLIGNAKNKRYGNGIELWDAAEDVTVQNNRISQVYDVALTAQGLSSAEVKNIVFSNNLATYSEQCFELWNRPELGSSSMSSVKFTRNTCVGSGRGWSNSQRDSEDRDGADVLMYVSTATTNDIAVTDNIFYGATTAVVRLTPPWNDYMQVDFGRNCYFPQSSQFGDMGLLLKQTGPNVLLKSAEPFNASFGKNTASSKYIDPMLSSDLIPSGACAGKGYLPPVGLQ